MLSGDRSDEERDMVEVIKERIEGGSYAVDPHAVAEAMLSRAGGSDPLQSLWSAVLVALQFPGSGEPKPVTGLDAP
jgi:hypothetical protein